MRHKVFCLLLLGLLTSLASAEVTVEGPARIAPGRMAAFTLKGLDQKYVSTFDWQVFGKPADATLLDMADRRTGAPVLIFQTDTPGRYAIIADVNVEPLTDCRLIIHEFMVGEPEPEPTPTPDTKAVFCVIIEERSDRTKLAPQRAMIFENESIRKLFDADKFQIRDDDVTNEDGKTPPEFKPYIDRARKLGLPALFLVDDRGAVLFEGVVPKDVAATKLLIRKYTEVQP